MVEQERELENRSFTIRQIQKNVERMSEMCEAKLRESAKIKEENKREREKVKELEHEKREREKEWR